MVDDGPLFEEPEQDGASSGLCETALSFMKTFNLSWELLWLREGAVCGS